jgi:hypothetical protein
MGKPSVKALRKRLSGRVADHSCATGHLVCSSAIFETKRTRLSKETTL